MADEYLRKLALALRIDADVGPLLTADRQLQAFVQTVTSSTPWLLMERIGRGLIDMAEDASEATVKLDMSAKSLRTTTQELQKLEYVAARANVIGDPLEKVSGLLQRIKGQMTQAAITPGGGSAGGLLGVLGIRPGQKPEEQIAAISRNLGRLPPALQNLAKSQLGLDELMPLLEKGPGYMREMGLEAERLGLVWGTETVQAGEKLHSELAALEFTSEGLKRQLQAELIPIGLEVVTTLRAWIPVILDVSKALLADLGIGSDDAGRQVKTLDDRIDQARITADAFMAKIHDVSDVVMALVTAAKLLVQALALRAALTGTMAGLDLLINGSNGIRAAIAVFELWRTGVITTASVTQLAMGQMSVSVAGLGAALKSVMLGPAGIIALLVVLKDLWDFAHDKPSLVGDLLKDPNGMLKKFTDFWAEVQDIVGRTVDGIERASNAVSRFAGLGNLFSTPEMEAIDRLKEQLAAPDLTDARRRQLQSQLLQLQGAYDLPPEMLVRDGDVDRALAQRYQQAAPSSTQVSIGDINAQITVNESARPGETAEQFAQRVQTMRDQQLREAAARTAPVYKGGVR